MYTIGKEKFLQEVLPIFNILHVKLQFTDRGARQKIAKFAEHEIGKIVM